MNDGVVVYYSAVCDVAPLERSEEIELTRALRNGSGNADAITRRLVEPNLRLVFHLVEHCGDCGVSPFDLLQIGNTALLNSVESYRSEGNGTSFEAHATPHIVKALSAMIHDRQRDV